MVIIITIIIAIINTDKYDSEWICMDSDTGPILSGSHAAALHNG